MASAAAAEIDRQTQVERLLAAARGTMAEVPFCWVVTPPLTGADAHARVVKDNKIDTDEDAWTRWFLARRVSRKVAEIRRAGRTTLAYQHDSGNAYVALSGRAKVVDERAEVERRFRPTNEQEAGLIPQMLVVRIVADHLELHIRGITAEPWGQGRTFLDRDADGSWRFAE
jgi:general stress protein 26